MNWLKLLPPTRREPPGFEWVVLRSVPKLMVYGTSLFVIPLAILQYGIEPSSSSRLWELYFIAGLIFFWTMLFTAALCALIVYLMKGPAFVADAYYLEDSDLPK
ncbi:MAG: hypothetical protein EBW95_05165 [Burkholderiaceae bacterium]|nr:hypothetical protein [Burkholderiaceae bacterium]